MKRLCFLFLAGILIQATRPLSPEPDVFVASTPCDALPRTLLSIPTTTDCELIKWQLTLRRDPRTQKPTDYTLHVTYGMSRPATTGFMKDLTGERSGTWSIRQEAGKRLIYRLEGQTPEMAVSFLQLDDNLLHLLDQRGKLMIGHAGWSYTMNRKQTAQ